MERAVISRIILKQTALVSFTLFFLRLCFIDGVGKKGTSFLAIVGVLVQLSAFFKIFKAVMAILVLGLNSSLNDYFVCYFFFVTSSIGWLYFRLCGFEAPKNTG